MIIIISGNTLSLYADDTKAELFKTLKIGVEEWVTQAEFNCDYLYKEYIVKTKHEAESFDFSNGELTFYSNGKIVKSNEMMFESINIEKDLYSPSQSENSILVVNKDLAAIYRPNTLGGKPQILFVSERSDEELQTPFPTNPLALNIGPLSYGSGRKVYNFFDMCDIFKSKYPNETEVKISTSQQQTINVNMSYDFHNQETTSIMASFSANFAYPVLIEKTTETRYYPPANFSFLQCVKATDFVDIGKSVMLPKRISSYKGPLGKELGDRYEGFWLIMHWSSENLGSEKPKESDFIIKLNHDTSFAGLALELQEKLKVDRPTIFDLNKFTLFDLQHSSELQIPPSNSKLIRYVIMFLGGVIIIVAIVMKWSKSRH